MSKRKIDPQKTLTTTGQRLSAASGRTLPNSAAWVVLAILVVVFPAAVLAGDDSGEGELDHLAPAPGTDLGTADGAAKALSCNPNGTYCTGFYEELVDWVRYRISGQVEILPTAEVRNSITAVGVCELYQGNKILIPAGEEYADRLLNQIVVARVFGERFRIQWIAGPAPTNYCQLRYIIVPY